MSLRSLHILLALGVSACASGPMMFPPVPAGYRYLDGSRIAEDERGPTYALDSVAGPRGMELWFGVIPPMDLTPLHAARRLDLLRLPRFGDDAVLVTADCSIDGTSDVEVIALAERPRTEEVTRIRRAWRADRRRERIVPIPPRGVACWMAQPRYCAGADLSGTDSVAMARRCAALFMRKNAFTQAYGGDPDQVSLDSDEARISLDTVRAARHATFEMEPEEVWCRGDSCGATFRYLGRDDCTAGLVTMDRDFAGLRLHSEVVTPGLGVPCVPRPPLATIPSTLPDSIGMVTVASARALFIFPVIPDTGAGWPAFATTASNYEWQAIVAGPDSAWIVAARIYRPTPATPSPSFRELVRKSEVGVYQISGGGRFQSELPQAIVQAEGSGGRAVIAVRDSTTVRRLFGTRPTLVRLTWCTPYGRCGDHRVIVRYEE